MDSTIDAFYEEIFNDPGVDREEAAELNDFLLALNAPPDKLTKLRSTAFKVACNHLGDDKETNTQLLRTVNYVVHAAEQNCMQPKAMENTVPLDQDVVTEFYKSVFDELTVDTEESESLYTFFKETNTPSPDDLVTMRALAFKVGCDYLQDADNETNIKLLRCINAVVHALEMSCYLPKPFHLKLEESVDLSMELGEAVQHLWDLDANRLTPNDDYVLNVQTGKKPYWKEDSARDPLFTNVDPAVWKRPTYASFLALLDNYIAETGAAESITDSERREVTTFLHNVMETAPMQFCHEYCRAKIPDKVPASRAGFVKLLQSIWFDLYRRGRGGRLDSSGFEHVFIGEVKNGDVSGFHNWIQFYLEEKKGTLDYRGYIKPRGGGAHHDDNDYLLTLQFAWNGVEKFVGTSFIGVSPEFEMALYTMCFLVGEEENHVQLNTGTDDYGVLIKCYSMAEGKIGTTFPEVKSHYEE